MVIWLGWVHIWLHIAGTSHAEAMMLGTMGWASMWLCQQAFSAWSKIPWEILDKQQKETQVPLCPKNENSPDSNR